MEGETLRLLRENNAMLRELLTYARALASPEAQSRERSREFLNNVLANILVDGSGGGR